MASLQSPWRAVLSVHLAARMVQRCCQGHADGLLFVPEHRTQPPLSSSLSSAHGLPAELIHHKQHTQKGVTNLSEPVVVVEWSYYSFRIIIVRSADLSDFSLIFVGEMCVFVSRPMKTCHFSSEKTITTQNWLLIFLCEKTHSETKSWKSSRILMEKLQQQR